MFSSYIRYFFKRRNEFHIHSPFVYSLYTKVIRGKQPGALRDLGIENTLTMTEGMLFEQNEAVMYQVEGIHQNKEKEAFWNTICANPGVTLTIDLYDRGLVFYREGMEKQNFILRR